MVRLLSDKKGFLRPNVKEAAKQTGQAAAAAGSWVAKAPVAVAEGKGLLPPTVRWFFQSLAKIIFFLGKWLFGIGAIALFVGGIVFLVNVNKVGLGETAVTQLGVTAEQAVPKAVEQLGLTNVYTAIFKPQELVTGYGFESDIDTSQGKILGVRIKDLQPAAKFYEGEDITVYGTIQAESIDEPLTINVFCSIEDEDQIPASEVAAPGAEENHVTLYPNTKEVIQATCTFPQAATFDSQDTQAVITSKKVTMYVTYEFTTKAAHKAYFLSQEKALELKRQNEDPFSYFKVNEPQLKADNTMRSKATPGPVNVGMGTYQSQPFSENIGYAFAVSLANNAQYGGNLKKLNDVTLYVPENIMLESDAEYGQELTEQCAFAPTGEQDDTGRLKKYSLKESERATINKDCEDITFNNAPISKEQCINFYKGDINLRCKFKVEELTADNLQFDVMGAEATYIYETKQAKAINILRVPQSGVTQGGEAIV